eukprot:CAMPEP_0202962016 /NCGR_PEP_ID=MMETSP1396-20130829/6116_1 /ASSEMBLY_ACC=CAM_ASM_000872 /TAXON_ID= /ORGANISM="Pseudokeronopsis sp., Strain Brazil" /LENGTH=72 /DNA_ID=CAMNT_0049682297 /DNA_START=238 /DNA_END=456 /DNA_ORIENTATION=+
MSINLNRNTGTQANSRVKPTISLTNSETGIKVVAKGNRITSSQHSDNTQHIERIPMERKYFKKDEVIMEQQA